MYIIDTKKVLPEIYENGIIALTLSTRNRGIYNFIIKLHTYSYDFQILNLIT